MSVSLLEVIEAGGYDLSTYDDANWILSKRDEFDELIETAEATVENYIDTIEALERQSVEEEE